jgi:hypothetical protein
MGEADLRKLSLVCAELGAVAALVLALGAPADAKSCTERLKTCQGFAPRESKYVSKECGFRQTIGARHSNAFAPSSTASSGATHRKPLS